MVGVTDALGARPQDMGRAIAALIRFIENFEPR
jgi:hypothetical protein